MLALKEKEMNARWRLLNQEITHYENTRSHSNRLEEKVMDLTKENMALKERIRVLEDPTNRKTENTHFGDSEHGELAQ